MTILIITTYLDNTYAAIPPTQSNQTISWYNDLIFKDNSFSFLVIDSADDQLTKGQAAQAHCQMGAIAISNEVIFAWLHKVFTEQ